MVEVIRCHSSDYITLRIKGDGLSLPRLCYVAYNSILLTDLLYNLFLSLSIADFEDSSFHEFLSYRR